MFMFNSEIEILNDQMFRHAFSPKKITYRGFSTGLPAARLPRKGPDQREGSPGDSQPSPGRGDRQPPPRYRSQGSESSRDREPAP